MCMAQGSLLNTLWQEACRDTSVFKSYAVVWLLIAVQTQLDL